MPAGQASPASTDEFETITINAATTVPTLSPLATLILRSPIRSVVSKIAVWHASSIQHPSRLTPGAGHHTEHSSVEAS